jgi:hypothetical protein
VTLCSRRTGFGRGPIQALAHPSDTTSVYTYVISHTHTVQSPLSEYRRHSEEEHTTEKQATKTGQRVAVGVGGRVHQYQHSVVR